MMGFTRCWVLALMLIATPLFAGAEDRHSAGVEFVFGIPKQANVGGWLTLHLAAEEGASVEVAIPALGFHQSVEVQAGQMTSIPLSTLSYFRHVHDQVSRHTVHLVASAPVNAYLSNYMNFSSDAFLLLPVSTLGREYYVLAYECAGGSCGSQFLISAIEDNTRVTITLPVDVSGYAAGEPFSIILNRLDSYYFENRGDLTGAHIRSDPHPRQ
jgi:hypothetical protein